MACQPTNQRCPVAQFPEWLDAVIDLLPVLADSPREDALPPPAGPEAVPRYLRVVPDTDLLVEFRVSDELSAVLLDAIHEDKISGPSLLPDRRLVSGIQTRRSVGGSTCDLRRHGSEALGQGVGVGAHE